MNNAEYLMDVLTFLVAAVVVVPIFQRFRSSPILGYLAAGIVIGPHGFAIIGDTKAAHTLAEFGVVFLLFMIGLELSFGRLRTLGSKVFGLGSLQVIITAVTIGAVAWGLGLGIEVAAIIGGGLALSSTAFVLQLLVERGERATPFGLTTFSILLLQDLAVVPLLILVTMLGTDGSSFAEAFGMATLKGAAALVIAIGFGRYLLKPLYRMIAGMRSSELFVSTTLLMILGMGWLMSIAGLSMELGALLAGLLLAETEYRHQVEADIKPFRGLLLGLFFMTIGMAINIGLIVTQLWLILSLVLALLVGKTIIIALLCRAFRVPTDISVKVGLILSQGGEFGFVIFGAAGALNLIPMDIVQLLLAVIALSMVVTPALVHLGGRISSFLRLRTENLAGKIDAEIKEEGNCVLIAGFGRVGQTIAKVLSDGGIGYLAIDNDADRVAECRAKGMPVYFGDANQISVLSAAGAEHAAAVVITLDQVEGVNRVVMELHKQNPELQIFVRALDMKHLRKLETSGATATVPETAEASLQLGAIVMDSVGIASDLASTIIENYRENDYALLEDIVGRSRR